ncbi:hypothetical protein FAM09_14460 [Niastella caeni]|uniref:YfhO family protein n=1 Tax=Niastella caeni TaxID=2569763 RepID=A0A4S8HW74_9BACT|nr:YfhO family protein [Niastella caeni]THU39695.1 hypothetical protein FAM09_14460 [Niastella caeni]
MNNKFLSRVLPHFIAVIIFLVVATFYCRPVLDGKVLQQADNVQWKAMAQNSFEFKEKYGRYPLWTNNLFSGMPTYQICLDSDIIITPNWFYNIFTLFLPKPISFFFLACICFYFLTQIVRINLYIGIIGGLAYAYATYNPIIIAVGHDTKMQSIALMPAFIASLMLIYEKKYLWGATLTAIITALLLAINHVQIIYYLLMIALFMTVGYVVYWVRQRDFRRLTISISIAVLAGILGTLSSAISLFTTYESSKTSIRGGSQLQSKTATKGGLSAAYAFDYSMYITEPFVMLVPKIYGGSDGLEVDEDRSKAIEQLRQMPPQLAQQLQYNLRFYWGGIGGTAGPPYVGAIICFLALFGFVALADKHKWWILATCILAVIMSWGSYFESFNTILLHVLPVYNKFRAPSMIIVIPTFLFCVMAVLALQMIVNTKVKTTLWLKYKKSLLFSGSIFLALLLLYFNADFTADSDRQLLSRFSSASDQVRDYALGFIAALKEDRKVLFFGSLVRSLLFVAAAALLMLLYLKNRIKGPYLMAGIGLLAFIDVIAIDVKYLNKDNYQDASDYQHANFTPSAADQQILQDKGSYRVFDVREGAHSAFNTSALSGYFHRSIGGYHPAKLSIYQDLIEHQLYNYPNCSPAINMLNTKYIIGKDSLGKDVVITNQHALGDAWFVNSVLFESTAETVMNALSNLNARDTAIVFTKDKQLVTGPSTGNSSDAIQLVENRNDEITYRSNAASPRFAVFSEIFYEKGWKAYIDNKEVPIVRTNYVLRGLAVPAGQHSIRFLFRPASYYTGVKVAKVAGIIIIMLFFVSVFLTYRRSAQKKSPNL